MDEQALAKKLETLLNQIKTGKGRVGLDSLSAAASSDSLRLADALWRLVREGKGALVGHERSVMAMLGGACFDAGDFISFLQQLEGENLFWLERFRDRVDGLAYHGWSKELEALLDKLLESGADHVLLANARLAEPCRSSLLYALARRSLVKAEDLPAEALSRLGYAFLWRGSWCPEQFVGMERAWPMETFARAAFAHASSVPDVGVYPATLEPLVGYATQEQLSLIVEKMVWPDGRETEWLASRGDAILPLLEEKVEDAKKNAWISHRFGAHIGALARIYARKGLPIKAAWIPLAERMLKQGSSGLRDLLAIVDVEAREAMLLSHLEDKNNWRDGLWPLSRFPSQRLVDALVKVIHETPKQEGWDFEREPLFQTLGRMGEAGQEALFRMLDEPDQLEGAIMCLRPTKERALRCLPFLGSTNSSLAHYARSLWSGLPDEDRIALLDAHLEVLPPLVAGELLAGLHAHLRTESIATRLPDTAETRALRQFCLSHPEPLRALMDAMAKVPEDSLSRARQALAPVFAERRDYSYSIEKALEAFGPEDLPAILRVTACKMAQRSVEISRLLEHFWPAREDLPWVAVYWWSVGDTSTLYAAERLMGDSALPALRSRLLTGYLKEEAYAMLLHLFASRDPVSSFDLFERFSAEKNLDEPSFAGIRRALAAGHAPARGFLEKALHGEKRDLALAILSKEPDLSLLPALQALQKQKLPAKAARLVKAAIAGLDAIDAPPSRSDRALSAKELYAMDGPIEALHVSEDGKTLCAQAAGRLRVWKGKQKIGLEGLGDVHVVLSLDGKYVLVMNEFSVDVYDAWKSMKEPCAELSPDDGLGLVVPMPGERAFTLCAAHNAYTPLTLWELKSGKEKDHKLKSFPTHVALLDEERYLLGSMDGAVVVRNLDTGKVLSKLQSAAKEVEDGVCLVAGGDKGKLAAALFVNGDLMVWDISGAKPKPLGKHQNAAPLALAADPGSRWVVTAGEEKVLTWSNGLPHKTLPGAGPLAGRSRYAIEGAGLALFVEPSVVAVGGQCVDLWDLEKGEHLGQWQKPVTTMATVHGKLFVGDADGKIHEIIVP